MRPRTHPDFLQLNNGNALRRAARTALTPLSLLIVLVVFWCLKLTGITLAGEAFCGFTEHIHGPDCPMQVLLCQLPEVEPHTHGESCIPLHLICSEPEHPAHSHEPGCLAQELICTLPEQEGHTHTDACRNKTLICSEEEYVGHAHTEDCYGKHLVCETPEEAPHLHSEDCYSLCEIPESEEHLHNETCTTLTCGLPETEGHSHSESCHEEFLQCTTEESPGHSHDESCYILEETFGCELEEMLPHTHSPECFAPIEGTYVCGLEETPGHTHTDGCWQPGIGFGCGLSEAEGHEHTAECLTDETELDCGLEATPGHSHAAECYDTLEACPLVEHIHTENCYSNLDADLETEDDWEDIQSELPEGLSTTDALVTMAVSQLGYEESTLNFQVDEAGIRRGITRYGQWYGNPYGDWSAMFVSFCLRYAGAEDLPANAGPESMRLEWEDEDLYRPAYAFHPEPGYLLFLDKDQNERADAVAIITRIEDGQITAIEGDLDNSVAETEYSLMDDAVMGYGFIPKREQIKFRPAEGPTLVAITEAEGEPVFAPDDLLVVYVEDPSGLYALDGFGGYVEVSMNEDGSIFTEESQPELLFWKVFGVREDGSYEIHNAKTGMYLDAALPPVTYAGRETENQTSGTQYAKAVSYTVYFDGTNGNLISLRGSDRDELTVTSGTTITLPATWKSPTKYSYSLKGWYDVATGAYYGAGKTMEVTQNTLLYADWVAQTYDLGEMNRDVSDTISTAEFITTHVFDYNALFNTLSLSNNYDSARGGNSTEWSMVASGTVPEINQPTLNFIFVDHDGSGAISRPRNLNNENGSFYEDITPNLYKKEFADILFDPDTEVIGKHYLGTGDHLFQYGDDPANAAYYGYYYYDSKLHAASYNQSEERFYIYDYLERTTDSANNSSYADFLPLNSPYANTNGKTVGTYSYNGVNGEYNGTTHYSYDARYDTDDSSANRVSTNFGFGLATELEFYLPATPGTVDSSGTYANQSMTGAQMIFEFSGDDDVWVFIENNGEDLLVLDIGGIHQEESGSINFSTGEVIVNGQTLAVSPIADLEPGTHKLTMYYLERGSSMSNFKLRFNLSTRYSLSLRKEDTLTSELLNGAQFSVYMDAACSTPAELWTSKEAHDRKETATNTFTVVNGSADMWGLAAGNTYYIKETRAPDAFGGDEGEAPAGLIRLYLNNHGEPDYQILTQDGEVTPGYTVHGFKIDEDSQQAFLVATNVSPEVTETTDVIALKQWADSDAHTGESVTVYLTITDPDGTVRRLQEAVLSSENGWKHQWTNLPKYQLDEDGHQLDTPVFYSVEEAYVKGYSSTSLRVEKTDEDKPPPVLQQTVYTWTARNPNSSFQSDTTYLIKSSKGYLTTRNDSSDTGFDWVSKDVALLSDLAQWNISTHNDGRIRLTNKKNQTLTFYYGNGRPTDFYATTSKTENNNSKNYFTYTKESDNQFRLYFDASNDYYLSENWNGSQKFNYTNTKNSGILLTAEYMGTTTVPTTVTGTGVLFTNTPLKRETSLTVHKSWDYGKASNTEEHKSFKVTVDLLANGSITGRTVTLTLKNGWEDTFLGLPYEDENGTPIQYTVQERWDNDDWVPEYGPIEVSNRIDPPTYSTTIVNIYRWGMGGPELPSTGTAGRTLYQLCGGSIILLTLACAIVLRRKREGGQE